MRHSSVSTGLLALGRPAAALLLCTALARCSGERTLITSDPYSPVRSGPSTLFDRITVLEEDVPLWAETKVGGWYRVRLHQALVGWVHDDSVEPQPRETARPQANVTDIAVGPCERGVRVTVFLTSKIPYRVRQCVGTRQLKLDLLGAKLAPYGVRCLPIEAFVTCVVPQQVFTDWVEITLDLDMTQQTGYDIYYASPKRLVLDIRRPYADGYLRGKTIALDAGHGGADKGAVGPTGLVEKDVNLRIALKLRGLLLGAGARVVMTRDSDTSLKPAGATLRSELTARVLAIKETWPDIFVSIHNNHVGSGAPGSVFGTETYYWTPMSARPAWIIHNALCAQLETQSRFVSWRPFRVLRETDTPRVLVECAYLSHPGEEALLRDDRFLCQAADGILNGLSEYFAGSVE